MAQGDSRATVQLSIYHLVPHLCDPVYLSIILRSTVGIRVIASLVVLYNYPSIFISSLYLCVCIYLSLSGLSLRQRLASMASQYHLHRLASMASQYHLHRLASMASQYHQHSSLIYSPWVRKTRCIQTVFFQYQNILTENRLYLNINYCCNSQKKTC